MKQEAIPSSAYDKEFWEGQKHSWWVYGADEEGKRKSEGEHPARIIQAFGSGVNILDTGAGMGWLVRFINQLGTSAIGVDYSEYAVKNSLTKGKMILGSVTSLPMFVDGQFDVVISREVFEHLTLEESERAFNEMLRVSSRYIYLTIWMNFDQGASDDVVLDDLERDPTHITYCTRGFWQKRFNKYIEQGVLVQRKDLETLLDWKQKGRCFVFEKQVS